MSTSSRFIKAGGYMLKAPAIDIAEVGTGAGSIAWIDTGGLLRVGPRSAGARPGPACYGTGGTEPTITDANVVLGYLDPEHLAGGELKLQAALAREAIERHVATPLGLSVEEAARGIRESPTPAWRAQSAPSSSAGDPRDFTPVASGEGPAHACDGGGSTSAACCARRPGVLPPWACSRATCAPLVPRRRRSRTPPPRPRPTPPTSLRRSAGTLAGVGYPRERVEIEALADLRYAGQASELVVPIPGGRVEGARLGDLRDAFDREYAATYGYSSDEPLELVNVRVVATGRREHRLDFRSVRIVGTPDTVTQRRAVHWARSAPPAATPVVARAAIAREPTPGPLIVEEYDPRCRPAGATVSRDASAT
jgi:N-methylhydantoinase A